MQMYQLYSEIFLFVFTFVFSLASKIFWGRQVVSLEKTTVVQFVMFVVQPLFYLHGDASFRNRIINQGIWKAFKRELSYKPQIEPQNELQNELQNKPQNESLNELQDRPPNEPQDIPQIQINNWFL